MEPLFAKLSFEVGGADRDRTDDLRLAKPALSQLSYSPGLLTSTKCFSDQSEPQDQRPTKSPVPRNHAGHSCNGDGNED